MQIAFRCCGENPPAESGCIAYAFCPRSKNDDIQLWGKRRHVTLVFLKFLVQRHRGFPPEFEPNCKFPTTPERQQLLSRPKRGSSGARSRAFQADLPQMQLCRTEVRVRRIMFVES